MTIKVGPQAHHQVRTRKLSLYEYLDRLTLESGGDTLITKKAVADLLRQLASRYPDDNLYLMALRSVAHGIVQMEDHEVLKRDSAVNLAEDDVAEAWRWPRSEWEEWQRSITAKLGSLPRQMHRLLVIEVLKPKGFWIGIEGSEDSYSLFVVDRARKFKTLSTLGWVETQLSSAVPHIPVPSGSLGWSYNSYSVWDETAADLAAQVLALAMRASGPEAALIKPLHVDPAR